MIERIAILGTGLLGTSVGLALRAADFHGSITGWNRGPEGAQSALCDGRNRLRLPPTLLKPRAQARSSCSPCPSTPRSTSWRSSRRSSAPNIWSPTWAAPSAIISEAGTRLYNTPERAAFLPGHPMAGKERGGAALGDANLFRGAVWLFTDDPHAQRSPQSAALVKGWREWVAAMGSKTLDLDPARHDELVAWVSHLPQFLATALSALLEERSGRRAGAERRGRPRPARDDAARRKPLLHVARHRLHQHRGRRPRSPGAGAAPRPSARKPAHPGAARRI